MKKKALMACCNYWDSPFHVGSHHIAKNLLELGWQVGFVSDPISLLHVCKGLTDDLKMCIRDRFNANYATTSYDKILEDEDIDAVLIATRHNLHAQMVMKALQGGKHVLVEKPLACLLYTSRCV